VFLAFDFQPVLGLLEAMAGAGGVISANNTILVNNDYYNGSLFAQTNSSTDTAYLGLDQQSNINLTIYPNNIAAISFPVEGPDIVWTFTLAQSIFDTSNYRIGIYCQYPLSGQYDMLPRGLFYLLLIFSLLFRRHNWLATAALGTAMTYAAVSAVHMFALVMNFDFGTPDDPKGWNINSSKAYGDVDVFGIYPILSAAAIMLTPILNWSVSIRANEAQMVVVYWGALVFAALVPAWIYSNYFKPWYINFPEAFALCPTSAAAIHPDCNQNNTSFNSESFIYCQCVDFCGLLGPSTSMRRHANMVPALSRPISELANTSQPLMNLNQFNAFVLAVIVVQGILGLIESQFTQAQVRNLVFRVLYAEPRDFIILLFEGQRQETLLKKLGMENASTKPATSLRWKLQFQIARLTAAAFFVLALFFAVLALAVFVTNLVTTEIYLAIWPVSEYSDAIGAWSSWVGATFVMIAAVIVKYHAAWVKSFVVAFQAFWRLVAWAANERHARFQSNDPEPETVRLRVKAFFSEISIPLVHAYYSTRRALWTVGYTIRTFVEWFKDPIKLSKQTRRMTEERAKSARKETCPNCECRMCRRLREEGADDDEASEKQRQNSSVGEKLVGGLERLYTVKRVSRLEDEEMKSIPDYGLPLVTTTSAISLPMPEEDGSPTSLAQPRQTYVRQNSDSSTQFSISRKPVRLRSESAHESDAPLLSHNSSELALGSDRFTSEPVDKHRSLTEFPDLTASEMPKGGNSGYGRLPSR
jgi:hypothetical protein